MTVHSSINAAWLHAVKEIYYQGEEASPRNIPVREMLGYQLKFDMKYPILTVDKRNLGYKFLLAEAWWIISGSNDVRSIKPYSKMIGNFSDDGVWFQGAYGPKLINQLSYIVDSLAKDQYCRQAVATIWEPNPRASKDHSCTVSIQWMIRNGKIHCIDNMRSSDIWLGLPYDAFNFAMYSAFVALALKSMHGIEVELGTFTLQSGNEHLYDSNIEKAKDIIDNGCRMKHYEAFDISGFKDQWALLDYLADGKDGKFADGAPLKDLLSGMKKGQRNDNWYDEKSK